MRELLDASVQTAADSVERIAADGIDAAMPWCHSLPTMSADARAARALSPPPAAGSLSAVPRLLRADPVLGVLLGAADATVAVPEAGPGASRPPPWPRSPSGRRCWW